MGIDGVIFDVPDSDANAAAFARPSAGPRGNGAFPQFASSAWSSSGPTSKSPWSSSAVVRRTLDGRALLPHLTAQMLLLWDRGFFSYTLWQRLTERKVNVLCAGD